MYSLVRALTRSTVTVTVGTGTVSLRPASTTPRRAAT